MEMIYDSGLIMRMTERKNSMLQELSHENN